MSRIVLVPLRFLRIITTLVSNVKFQVRPYLKNVHQITNKLANTKTTSAYFSNRQCSQSGGKSLFFKNVRSLN